MRDLTDRALDTASSLGAGYADIRVVRRLDESVAIRTGRVEGVASGESEGFGVRVLVDGAWGFASSHLLTATEMDRVAGEAVRIARASATALRDPAVLADRPPAIGQYETPVAEDPFAIPLERKIGDLLAADQAASGVKGIAFTESMYAAEREWKTFAATDGSFTEQVITHCGTAVEANAVDGDEHQRRSLPGFRRWLERRRLRVHPLARPRRPSRAAGGRGRRAAAARRSARPAGSRSSSTRASSTCRSTRAAATRRSSIASSAPKRPTPGPASSPPTSSTRGSATAPTSSTSSPTRPRPAAWAPSAGTTRASRPSPCRSIQDGILVGYLSSRETATKIGRASGGAMRADGWNRIPLIRMTNINLLPKPGMSLDDIVADTDDGLYLSSNRSWSIDDRRLNFQFATEVAYEIKGGKKGRLFKNPTYTGITYEFWRSCDAVGDESGYVMLGTPNCGKGEPGQGAHVGHAVPGARFRNVQVGVGKW